MLKITSIFNTQHDNVYDFIYRFDLDDYLHLKK